MTISQTPPQIDNATVNAFKGKLRGHVLKPVDEGYDEARSIWNALIDRRPAVIARCADAGDVVTSVQFAREQGLDLAIRGGGHGVAGNAVCDGGLMIDLSPMQGLEIDPERRIAKVEGGVTWGALDREAQKHGLATTGGIVPTTGVAGLTLGGGLGYLMRSYGLACDNLLSADVVTAEGEQIRASAGEHPELFWGIRGGGGNFGVVTSFEFQLHSVGPLVLGGLLIFPMDRAVEVSHAYREVVQTAPDELVVHFALVTSQDGQPVAANIVCYNGAIDEGERVIKPLRDLAPVADMVAPIPYVEMQALAEPLYPRERRHYWKSSFIREFNDAAVETMIAQFARVPSPLSGVALEQLGGAMSRVDASETAFGDRSAPYSLIITSQWADRADDEPNIRWARDHWTAIQPYAKEAAYINYLDAGDEARVRAAYAPSTYDRLVALKQKYDPTNFFHLNANIAPEE
jgi:FAD/FMN-containing dehydrogenase